MSLECSDDLVALEVGCVVAGGHRGQGRSLLHLGEKWALDVVLFGKLHVENSFIEPLRWREGTTWKIFR